jgi:hypothetical protein
VGTEKQRRHSRAAVHAGDQVAGVAAGADRRTVYDRFGSEGDQPALEMSGQPALLAGYAVDAHEFLKGFRQTSEIDHLTIQGMKAIDKAGDVPV